MHIRRVICWLICANEQGVTGALKMADPRQNPKKIFTGLELRDQFNVHAQAAYLGPPPLAALLAAQHES